MNTYIIHNQRAALVAERDSRAPLEFHRRLPGYAPTPLVEAPSLAATLGIGKLWIKDEASRLGLPAFKILGASWACYLALHERMGGEIGAWNSIDELAAHFAPLRPLTLAAATDGNHGRAVARMAALLGFAAHIFVPAGTAAARIRAIEGEGAQVVVVDGTYDEAVALAAEQAGPRCLVISDTAWPGYETVPRDVIAGYSTIFWEVDDELARRGEAQPDLVVVQIGVGALAAAVVRHYRHDHPAATNDQQAAYPRSSIIGVEPTRAACVLESIRAGHPVELPGPHDSIMAGLNCGTPSPIAWPLVCAGIDLFVAIEDTRAEEGMRALAEAGVVAGETGAAGVGGLLELLTGPSAEMVREALGITPSTSALVISTEGATDPDAYARIVGRPAGAPSFAPLTDDQIQAVHIGGQLLHNRPIDLAEYDPEWPRLFEREAARVRAALGDRVLLLEHAGSTSVPGLAAKPRIDMLLVVANTADEAAYVPELEAAGYVLKLREPDWFEHRLFRGPDTDINLHVFSHGCPEVEQMLLFRDWLRSNIADRALYERTKRELAQRAWKYVQNYADAKTAVVHEILARARQQHEA